MTQKEEDLLARCESMSFDEFNDEMERIWAEETLGIDIPAQSPDRDALVQFGTIVSNYIMMDNVLNEKKSVED